MYLSPSCIHDSYHYGEQKQQQQWEEEAEGTQSGSAHCLAHARAERVAHPPPHGLPLGPPVPRSLVLLPMRRHRSVRVVQVRMHLKEQSTSGTNTHDVGGHREALQVTHPLPLSHKEAGRPL